METNSISVTKKEFYSVTTGILGYLFITVMWAVGERGWTQYIVCFFLLASLIFYSHKSMKEKRKRATSKLEQN